MGSGMPLYRQLTHSLQVARRQQIDENTVLDESPLFKRGWSNIFIPL